EFARAAPELAKAGEERFERWGLILLGSMRKDGTPRISPVEPLIVGGELMLGMMWQSKKALDLLREPRCLVHSIITDRMGHEGEFKLRGRARDVADPDVRETYSKALFEKIGFRPEGLEWHLFAIDIEHVALIAFENEEKTVQTWPDPPVTRRIP
ncbi:MAG TPA: hypothetical protein VIW01_03040, partial [Dehalococcoidia bacterium]